MPDCFLSRVARLWDKNVHVWLSALPGAHGAGPGSPTGARSWRFRGARASRPPSDGEGTAALPSCVVTAGHFRASVACQSQAVADAIRVSLFQAYFKGSPSLLLPGRCLDNTLYSSLATGKLRTLVAVVPPAVEGKATHLHFMVGAPQTVSVSASDTDL